MPAMKQNQPTIITSSLKQHYQLVLPGDSVNFPAAVYAKFQCQVSAESFIRRELNYSDTFWRNIIRQYFSEYFHELSSHSLEALVGKLTFIGKIRFYRLPALEDRKMANNGQGKCYRFLQGPEKVPEGKSKVIDFNNERILNNVLDSLNESESFWLGVLEENNLPAPQGNASAKAAVKKNLANGKLRVYESQYRAPLPKPQESSASAESAPGARPVPLAPETDDGWVEIKLTFEDGEAIADQKYVIIDPDGNEHKGTTNAQGKAKVSNITAGNCEFKFPELEGWS